MYAITAKTQCRSGTSGKSQLSRIQSWNTYLNLMDSSWNYVKGQLTDKRSLLPDLSKKAMFLSKTDIRFRIRTGKHAAFSWKVREDIPVKVGAVIDFGSVVYKDFSTGEYNGYTGRNGMRHIQSDTYRTKAALDLGFVGSSETAIISPEGELRSGSFQFIGEEAVYGDKLKEETLFEFGIGDSFEVYKVNE